MRSLTALCLAALLVVAHGCAATPSATPRPTETLPPTVPPATAPAAMSPAQSESSVTSGAADAEIERLIRDGWTELADLIAAEGGSNEAAYWQALLAFAQSQSGALAEHAPSTCTRQAYDNYVLGLNVLEELSRAFIDWHAGVGPEPDGERIQDVALHTAAALRALDNGEC